MAGLAGTWWALMAQIPCNLQMVSWRTPQSGYALVHTAWLGQRRQRLPACGPVLTCASLWQAAAQTAHAKGASIHSKGREVTEGVLYVKALADSLNRWTLCCMHMRATQLYGGINNDSSKDCPLELTVIELMETSLLLTMESTTLARRCEVTFLGSNSFRLSAAQWVCLHGWP